MQTATHYHVVGYPGVGKTDEAVESLETALDRILDILQCYPRAEIIEQSPFSIVLKTGKGRYATFKILTCTSSRCAVAPDD